MRIALFIGLTFLLGFATAQTLSQDEVLENLRTRAETLEDAQFLLTGMLVDPDGTEIILEVDVQVIPPTRVARADIYQPDALADNSIIVDGDALYNYIFLTNQATIFDVNDPDALGGFLPAGGEGEGFEFTLDLESLFAGWDLALSGYSERPEGNVYELRFINKEEGVRIDYVDATVLDELWLPSSMTFITEDGSLLAELNFNDFVVDSGLNADDVVYLPDDVEIIDER